MLAALLPPGAPPRPGWDDGRNRGLARGFDDADVDLFLVGLDAAGAIAALASVRHALGPSVAAIVRTSSAVTFARSKGRHVQVRPDDLNHFHPLVS